MSTQPRFFVPEVVQTSEMDCGPASLKALLEGFGIPVSYGRLREACQTEVDGTSINTIEQVAVQLGLNAEQIMIPADHLLLTEASALPALVVVRLPNGMTHFVIIWSKNGRFVQVMDPGTGRRWVSEKHLLAELYIHRFPVPAMAFRDWAGTDEFLAPLRRRLGELHLSDAQISELIVAADTDPNWQGLAALDAATRMVTALVRANGLPRGEIAAQVVTRFFQNAQLAPTLEDSPIPAPFWFVEPLPRVPGLEVSEQLLLRGAVLVRVRGRMLEPEALAEKQLPPELVAALREPPLNPEKELWRVLRQDGLGILTAVVIALFLAAFGVTIEALLLQGVLKLGLSLPESELRWAAIVFLFAFVSFLFVLEVPLNIVAQRIGRRLETRLRILLLEKIPRLSDRYFHSRLTSDMTMRAHGLRSLRTLPTLAVNILRLGFQIGLTALGIILLDPVSAPWAIGFALAFGVVAYFSNIIQREGEMRLLTHNGALNRFYLDALAGLIPARMHGAERALRRQHEMLLTEWARASFELRRTIVALQGSSATLNAVFAVVILLSFVARGGQIANMLLLFYWTLNLTALSQSVFTLLQQYPLVRNQTLRLLEPLGAPDENAILAPSETVTVEQAPVNSTREQTDHHTSEASRGVAISLRNVAVQAGGNTILSDISLEIRAGEHVAIVGPSGAGKSSLVGILLGWHKPTGGQCLIDGTQLDGDKLRGLRRETAWVNPAVQLWNRSLLANLQYGNQNGDSAVGKILEEADLFDILERLPEGMQTALGEGGGLVSGGEGQRVRFARALKKKEVRLAILDEPFRGLDRGKRRALLLQARSHWRDSTMLCITHDVGETRTFDRVVVVENGRIVEDAAPLRLSAEPTSRYRAMLEAEEAVRHGTWESTTWRRLWIADGKLREHSEPV